MNLREPRRATRQTGRPTALFPITMILQFFAKRLVCARDNPLSK